MLQVTVSGNTREELIAHLASWIDLLSGQRVGDQQLKPEEPVEGKKRGRPAKTAAVTLEQQTMMPFPMEAQAVTPSEQATPEPKPTASVLTLQDAINALKGVAAVRPGDTGPTDGYQRVSKILIKYGYKNVKEIKSEHFEAVIADCQGGV